ncbi:hypothetical protein [Desulfarculus baarsii]|uniref:hypothetical protein n=1 Tax=Desulfarculus baarsii TaxID=453230 RepID=UPI000309051B|nr:hypothetical protein [Desulfarculus baarsii]
MLLAQRQLVLQTLDMGGFRGQSAMEGLVLLQELLMSLTQRVQLAVQALDNLLQFRDLLLGFHLAHPQSTAAHREIKGDAG